MTLTRRSLAAAGLAAPLFGLASRVGASTSSAEFAARARAEVQSILRERGIAGAAAALIVDGRLAWMEALGERADPAHRPVDLDTIFSVQSTSKHFTATAVMMAVQRGLVDLDTPLTRYMPEFTVSSRHETEPERRMTLRHLLSHRAGFTHEAPVGSNFVVEPRADFRAHVDSIRRTWLRYPVGERYAYSNLGVDLAGHVLERVTGMTFPDVLRRWIFDPLGMTRTTADPDVYEPDANRAVGQIPGFDTVPVRIPIIPSGGVYSSIADMAKYAGFHLRRGASESGPLLDPGLWSEMHDFRYGVFYALGVARRPVSLQRRTLALYTHNGGGFGFGCCFFYSPSENVAWIVLYNGSTGDDPFNAVMPGPVLEARHGPLAATPPNPNPIVQLAPDALRARAGLYMNRDSRCVVTLQDGALLMTFQDRRAANRLAFVSDDEGWIAEGMMRGGTVRFGPPAGLEAAYFEFPPGDRWDFIDGPAVGPGPLGSEYDDRLGIYEVRIWDRPVARIELSKRNGWLYYQDVRMSPYRPGLLFAGNGEVLDLRGAVPAVRNIPLHRVSAASPAQS